MKDYSEHFENPEAFLTDVELTNDSIIAKFPKGYKKTVEKNKENYQKFNERMEQQYLKLINNAGKLLKKYKTISKMKEASLEELEEILPKEVAVTFKEFLDNYDK